MGDNRCSDSVSLGIEDVAYCQRDRDHDGDHFETWTTNPPDPVEVKIRWRTVKPDA